MKKTIFSLFTIFILSITQSFAQEDKKDFLFLGGTFGVNDQYNTNVTLGAEGVYMRKVWRGLAIGGGANIDFGLPSKASTGTYKGSMLNPGYEYESIKSFNRYGLSLLIGGLFEHRSGGRTAFIFGPEYGKGDYSTKTKRTYLDSNIANDSITDKDEEEHFMLRAGVYHTFKNTNWTVGLNARYGIATSGSDLGRNTQVGVSVGYAF